MEARMSLAYIYIYDTVILKMISVCWRVVEIQLDKYAEID